MAAIKYKVGDIVKRISTGNSSLITKIELGYYTLHNIDWSIHYLHNVDLSCSTVDNEKVFEFVEHLSEEEFNKRKNE